MKKLDWKGLGQFLALFVQLVTIIIATFKKVGVSIEVLGWLCGDGNKSLATKLTELGEEYKKTLKQATEALKTLRVDFSLSLQEMIALGKYGWVNSDITPSNFPLTGKGLDEVEYKIYHFDKEMKTKQVEDQMEKDGYKPGKIWHLLSFGAQNPEEQKKYPIIALGSSVGLCGFWRVPFLDFGGGGRRLSLYCRDGVWSGGCRFLAVRKPSDS